MNTFQSVIAALLSSLGDILPVGKDLIYRPMETFLGWPSIPAELHVAFTLGVMASLVFYFRYDLLSMISSLLRIAIERRKPMTLDERMPFFMAFAIVPLLSLEHWVREWFTAFADTFPYFTWLLAFLLVFGGLLLYLADYFGKHQRHIFDWNVVDAFLLGILLLASPIPGFNLLTLGLIFAHYRNYRREAASKFCYLIFIPHQIYHSVLGWKTLDLQAAAPAAEVTWLSWSTALAVAAVTTYTVLSSVMKVDDRAGYARVFGFRIVLGVAIAAGILFKS